jgi:aspartyl protease family protein
MRSAVLIGVVLLAAVLPAAAQSVFVVSVAPGQAQIIVNGSAVHTLRPGQSTPEGVRLVRIDGDAAVIESGGRAWTMRLGQSTVASAVLPADARGHFWANLLVNGIATRAMVDTGASTVAMNLDESRRLGVDLSRGVRTTMQTANGPQSGWRVMLPHVQVGEIALAGVEGFVVDGGSQLLPVVLLGMSFLRHVDLQRSGTTMSLTKRH